MRCKIGGMKIQSLTITSAREQLQTGTLSAVQLREACFLAIKQLNPVINAFITVLDEGQNSVSGLKDSALAGIPIAVKDLYQTAGVLTTAGTTFFSGFHP